MSATENETFEHVVNDIREELARFPSQAEPEDLEDFCNRAESAYLRLKAELVRLLSRIVAMDEGCTECVRNGHADGADWEGVVGSMGDDARAALRLLDTRTVVKPCPFCGSDPQIERLRGPTNTPFNVLCANADCAARPRVCAATEAGAIDAWNRRAGDEPEKPYDPGEDDE